MLLVGQAFSPCFLHGRRLFRPPARSDTSMFNALLFVRDDGARAEIQENLFAFLPAKAGSGCTTVALNTAGYMADTSRPDSVARKVLLIESDIRSGVLSVLLGIHHKYSLRDALDDSEQLDYSRWT